MKQKKNLTSALTYHRQLLIETAEKIGIYGTAGGVSWIRTRGNGDREIGISVG